MYYYGVVHTVPHIGGEPMTIVAMSPGQNTGGTDSGVDGC